jgi:hypothetical protein
MEDIEGFYATVDGGKTAIIEMAAAASLPMVAGREDPRRTTTYGVGELIRDAVARGCKKIVVGLGGSCTNDMGVGAAAGAGALFYDADGKSFIPTGATLSRISKIDIAPLKEMLGDVEIIAMCDIDNPLYGESGAAYVFSPQKGAKPDTVKLLDDNLKACAATVKSELGVDVADLPGAGAAGGMGAGMVAFFGATLKPGIDTVLDTVDFERIASDFPTNLMQVINRTMETDIPLYANINISVARKLQNLIVVIAESVPFKPNYKKLAEITGISRNDIADYIYYMERAGMLMSLHDTTQGIRSIGKSHKLYVDNTNLMYVLSPENIDKGNLRETFFLNQMRVKYPVIASQKADFEIGNYIFEVGGKNKNQKQLDNNPNGYIVKDDIEFGYRNVIPLWAFGLTY